MVSQDTLNVAKVFPYLLELQKQKGSYYGRSYCKHGHLSIFMNLERKWDRLANIIEMCIQTGMKDFLKEGSPTETVVDTIADLATYSLLWLGYIQENNPELIDKFIKSNGLTEDTCKALVKELLENSSHFLKYLTFL